MPGRRTILALCVAALASCNTERTSMELLCDSPMHSGAKLEPWGNFMRKTWHHAKGRIRNESVKQLVRDLAGVATEEASRLLRDRATGLGLATCVLATAHDLRLEPYCTSVKPDALACHFERRMIATWIQQWGRDLRSSNESVRSESFYRLHKLGPRAAPAAALVARAIEDRPALRDQLVDLAIQIGPEASLAAMRSLLRPGMPRESSGTLLRKFTHHWEIVIPVARSGMRDRNPIVRQVIAQLLGNMEHNETRTIERRRAAAAVLVALARDRDPDVRFGAAISLRRHSGLGFDSQAVQVLASLIDQANRPRRRAPEDPWHLEDRTALVATTTLGAYPARLTRGILERVAAHHLYDALREDAKAMLNEIDADPSAK